METTSLIALSRQDSLKRQMSTVAHNLANMNTSGFKAERMMFVEHLVKNQDDNGIRAGRLSFVRDVATFHDLTEGPMNQTGNPLDLAVREDGFFTIENPEGGELYTRSGNFMLNNDGQLVTSQGYRVLAEGGQPLTIGAADTDIIVAADGTVSSQNGDIGRLQVVTFEDRYNMQPKSGGMFSTDQVAQVVDNPQVVQGMLEGSNVVPILEMTRMIEVSKAYTSANKMVEGENERLRRMIREMASQQG